MHDRAKSMQNSNIKKPHTDCWSQEHQLQVSLCMCFGGCCKGWNFPVGESRNMAKVNQQPPMHQLAVLSTGCLAFFHSAPNGVHRNPFLFAADHCTFFYFFFWFLAVFPGPALTHTYPTHFLTLISIAPSLVPYLLSPTDTATLITISY